MRRSTARPIDEALLAEIVAGTGLAVARRSLLLPLRRRRTDDRGMRSSAELVDPDDPAVHDHERRTDGVASEP